MAPQRFYRGLHAVVHPWQNRLWLRAKGVEHLPREGGVILASNHASNWDPVSLGCAIERPIGWLAKKELFRGRIGNWFFTSVGCIRVDRDTKNPLAFEHAVQALRDGRVIGVFPQGTRRPGRELGPAKTGAARLALQTGAPVVPVAVASERFWPRGRKAPKLNERVYVRFGEPMTLAGDAHEETARIMAQIERLLAEAQAARDAGEAWPIP